MNEPLVLVANAGDDSIRSYRLRDDALEPLATTAGLASCACFVVDAERDLVYAGVKGEPAGIVTLSLDRASGALTPVARRDLDDGSLSFVSLTPDGSALLGASYSGDYGIVAPLDGTGVGEPVQRISHSRLHSVLPSADGAFAYFVSLGDDLIAQYAIGDDLSLTPLDPPTVAAPAGSGPRHLALSDSGDAVYVNTEYTGEVLHFARDQASGVLSFVGAVTAHDLDAGLTPGEPGVDPRPDRRIWAADLHLGAGGRTLWASERTSSTLGAVTVAPDGTLAAPKQFAVTETQPRGFALNSERTRLVVAGEASTTLSLYAVDGDALELLARVETGSRSPWVRFA